MLSTILMLVVIAALALAAYAATQPDTFRISRTANIKVPPEKVFPLINNLRNLNTWLPFVKPDPNIRLDYSGQENGIGAINDFSGNSKVGAGRVEITDSIPPSKVTMRLQMTRPITCDNRVEFTLHPADGTTDVTWAMSGKSSIFVRMMCAFLNHDKMVGGQFEKGLADLKVIAEK